MKDIIPYKCIAMERKTLCLINALHKDVIPYKCITERWHAL